jgi:hypothetical protein
MERMVRDTLMRRLWPLIVAVPLLAGCAGGYSYELPPDAFTYTRATYEVPARRFFAPPPRFIPQAQPAFGVPIPPPPSGDADIVLPSTPAPPEPAVAALEASPAALVSKSPEPPPQKHDPVPDTKVSESNALPERHKPPPDTQADAERPSPTCGYWRLGCGILWP